MPVCQSATEFRYWQVTITNYEVLPDTVLAIHVILLLLLLLLLLTVTAQGP